MASLPTAHEMQYLDPDGLTVWHVILQAEANALETSARVEPKHRDPVISIRLLGFLLKDFLDYSVDWNLGQQPYEQLKIQIKSCRLQENEHQALVELGLRYRNYLLRVFRSNTGSRPTSSRHPSRSSFDVAKQRILDELKDTKAPRNTKGVKNQALLRDGFRCVISGMYDTRTRRLYGHDLPSNCPGCSDTQVAHLFSGSAQEGNKDYVATVFTILEAFGLGAQARSLYASSVNELHNVITLESRLHDRFDKLEFWLEPVAGEEHTYNVCGVDYMAHEYLSILAMPMPSRITFSVDPSAAADAAMKDLTLDLPDPLLVAIRAICARVCNMSGAAEHADQILEDLEGAQVLANDGSMGALLASRLTMLTI